MKPDEIRQTWSLGKGDTLNEVGASEVIHDLCDEVDRLREALQEFIDTVEMVDPGVYNDTIATVKEALNDE